MDTSTIIVILVAFNLGFLAGAFWVAAKGDDARELARQDMGRWLRSKLQ